MKVIFKDKKAILKNPGSFDPAHIFENGQAFRFADVGNGVYEGVAHGRFLRVYREKEDVVLYPVTKEEYAAVWEDYFDLRRAYGELFSGCDDDALERGREFAQGLRILKQQPFETLVSFIISANNNIKRIRSIVERLCVACGTPFVFEGKRYYAFPTPQQLAGMGEQELVACGAGYRAPYIKKTAQMVAQGFDLEAIGHMGYDDAKQTLMQLPGVGPKVADCVLLFAYAKMQAFPADVWVKRILKTLYNFEGTNKQICEFARAAFGENAGIAQQYLFYFARETGLR